MIYEDEGKSQDELKKNEHISYKEYKKKLDSNSNEGLILFVSAFFVMVILFLGIAKQLSPDVDVSIADNNEESVVADDESEGNVDDRLKLIQMEDNSYNNNNDDTFSPELEEKVQLPNKKRKTVGEYEAETNFTEKTQEQIKVKEDAKPPKQEVVQSAPTIPIAQPVNAKVIVGYYATQQQAEVAKSIIQDAGLNIQPFVKNIGSAYTLQVGSFTSKEKAQSVANDLLKNNFPARVIVE